MTVPAAAFAGMLTIGKLCAIVLGAAKVVHDAAAISLLPAVVDPDQLQDANAKLGAASSVADSAGTNAGAALAGRLRRDAGCLRRDHGRRWYRRRGRCAARAQDRRPDRHRPHDHRRVRGQPSRPSTPAPRGSRDAVADRPGRHTGRAVVLGDGVRDQPTFPAPSRMRPLVPGPDAVRQYHSHRRARPLAAATAGSPVLALDVRTTLAIGALLQIVPVVLLLASPIRTLRKIPTRAAVPPARGRSLFRDHHVHCCTTCRNRSGLRAATTGSSTTPRTGCWRATFDPAATAAPSTSAAATASHPAPCSARLPHDRHRLPQRRRARRRRRGDPCGGMRLS
ncbi:hypothetical protein SBADM41S_04352 [Streptomyces badius]